MLCPITRFNVYAFIHKGMRAHLIHTLYAIGRCDWQNCSETRIALAELHALLSFCRSHIYHEDKLVHQALEQRKPGATRYSGAAHRLQCQTMDELENLAEQVMHLPARRRGDLTHRLYRRLAQFVAECFEHLEQEERDNNRLLWETHSDAELIALEQRILACLSPVEMQRLLYWMLPALTPDERASYLLALRAKASADWFAATLETLKGQLTANQWSHLESALNLVQVAEPIGLSA